MVLKQDNSFLVVIDVQQRLLAAMPNPIGEALVLQATILAKAANTLDIPVMVTEQYSKGLGATVATLQPHLSSASQIEKTCFSCASADDFMTTLRASHRRQVILTGMEAHICVLQTALALLAQGFQVFVVEDAVCSRSQQNQDNAMQRLRQAGVIITNAESVLFEWLADAKHPQFKALSQLIV
ncbi:MAG: hydrolase [Methylophaga sp.]|nr:MAG: hydrolase [Methylophaga sp.]